MFEPHVTIHVGADRTDLAEQALMGASRQCAPITLEALEIEQSDEFIKTLFVQLAMTSELQKFNESIRQAATDPSQYELKPHLSLLYQKLSAETRRELAASISVPFSEVTFDAIKAVRCVSPTESCVDVQAWRVVAAASLLG